VKSRGKIIAVVGTSVVIAALFALLAIGLINRSPVTGRSGLTRVGKAAPDISMPLLGGGTFELSEHLGDPIVINFWASWCPPCRRESPLLERTWRAYADQGVQFVGVDIQDIPEDAQAYVDEFDLTFPNGMDRDGTITVDYGVIGLPITFFIGAGGIVEGRFVGALREDGLVAWVESLIAGMPRPGDLDDENPESYFKFE
jgi:cytochrome c biogenesis protein CcmG/thiol:disulfide interchange protein DsbE